MSVGDRLSMDLSIVTSEPAHRDLVKQITYLVRQECYSAISTQSQRKKQCEVLIMSFSPPKLSQVLNKGKIIEAQRVDVSGQLVTSIGLTVTPEMMPSFRIVAFYNIHWSSREEVVPDSIWVDVVDSCAGGVRSAECQGSEVISGSQAGSPAVEQIASL